MEKNREVVRVERVIVRVGREWRECNVATRLQCACACVHVRVSICELECMNVSANVHMRVLCTHLKPCKMDDTGDVVSREESIKCFLVAHIHLLKRKGLPCYGLHPLHAFLRKVRRVTRLCARVRVCKYAHACCMRVRYIWRLCGQGGGE